MINNCIQCNNVSASGSCGSDEAQRIQQPSSNSYVHNFMYTACVGGGGGGGCDWMAVKLVLRLTFIKHSVS